MIKLKITLFVGLLLGWTYGQNTNIDLEIVTGVPTLEIEASQYNVSSTTTTTTAATTTTTTVKPVAALLNNENQSIEDIYRIAQSESDNEVIESLSPANFIFNSCELRRYKPSREFLQRFPYYLSGFDGENRPIWVAEMGKFDLNSINTGNGTNKAFQDFAKDVVFNFIKSLFIKTGPGRPTFEFIFIIDFEGFSKEQIKVDNVLLVLKLARLYIRLLEEYAYSVVLINVNPAAESLGPIVRQYAEQVLEKTSIFGLDKSTWMPYLKRTIPADQLPAFYGGQNPNFKPVRVYG